MSRRSHRPAPSLPCAALAALAALAAAPTLEAQARPRPGTLPGQAPPPRPAPTMPTGPGGEGRPGAAAPARPAPATGPGNIVLRGIVWDSLANAPLANATVQVANVDDATQALTATSDSLGEYRIRGLRPGRWVAGFFHPAVDAIGIELEPVLARLGTDTLAILDFGTPGPRAIRAALCPQADPGTPMLLGAVRDAESGASVEGARVVFTWRESRIADGGLLSVRRRLPVRARPDGNFVACGLPANEEVEVGAEAPKRTPGGLVQLALPAGAVIRRDFALGDSASVVAVVVPDTTAAKENRPAQPTTVARGNARVTGSVTGPDGRPLQGAKLVVWGTGITGTTGPNGTFALTGLPSGTYSVEVRAIGFTPKRMPVDLAARRPAQLAVRLDTRVATLEGVRVTEKATAKLSEFEERRRKGGFGRFIGEEEITNRNAFVMSDVLRTTPGMRIIPRGGAQGGVVRGRGDCVPAVFVDGSAVINGADDLDDVVRPQDVAGVEVYNGPGGTPPQFMTQNGGGCGVVAIWTKRGGPAARTDGR